MTNAEIERALEGHVRGIEFLRDLLPEDLRADGTQGPNTDEDHCGMILENACDHLSEVIHALRQNQERRGT